VVGGQLTMEVFAPEPGRTMELITVSKF